MIVSIVAILLSSSQVERCETVRQDHEQFKAWTRSNLEQFEATKTSTPAKADRAQWKAFELKVDAAIDELNRRYANCKED